MARSWRLVGIAFSTFGLYLREYRAFKVKREVWGRCGVAPVGAPPPGCSYGAV